MIKIVTMYKNFFSNHDFCGNRKEPEQLFVISDPAPAPGSNLILSPLHCFQCLFCGPAFFVLPCVQVLVVFGLYLLVIILQLILGS
jgi:hypothetical protein